MVFWKKALWVGTIWPSDLQGYWTKVHRTFFAERGRNRGWLGICPIMNICIRSGDIRCRSLNLSEIGPNFACFWPLQFFGEGLSKFWTGIIKFYYWLSCNILHRSADGAWRSRVGITKIKHLWWNISPLRKLLLLGRLIRNSWTSLSGLPQNHIFLGLVSKFGCRLENFCA